MAAGEKWNEVYRSEEGTYPAVRAQVFALTFDRLTMCAHRRTIGLLPACVVAWMGVTREFGNYETLKAKYPDAEHMEDGVKKTVLFGHLGREPDWSAILRLPAATFPPTTAVDVALDGDSEELSCHRPPWRRLRRELAPTCRVSRKPVQVLPDA